MTYQKVAMDLRVPVGWATNLKRTGMKGRRRCWQKIAATTLAYETRWTRWGDVHPRKLSAMMCSSLMAQALDICSCYSGHSRVAPRGRLSPQRLVSLHCSAHRGAIAAHTAAHTAQVITGSPGDRPDLEITAVPFYVFT